MDWRKKYRVVKVKPGKIVCPWGETLDLSNPHIPIEKIDRLYESGCPFILLVKTKVPDKSENLLEEIEKQKPKRGRN